MLLLKCVEEVALSTEFQFHLHFLTVTMSDMIKENESDVRNIDFELHAKRGDKFLFFTLFFNLKKCSYLCNQMSDWDGV